MDRWDYAFSFSSELLVIIIGVLVSGFTGYFLVFASDTPDKSLANHFLSYHNTWNEPLYARNASIKTFIVQRNSFIPEAFADTPSFAAAAAPSPDDTLIINENTIEQQSPDSIQVLLDKQIKVYETQEGETLVSLSKEFNISQDTIKWANNLPNNTIKPGWQLIILPTSGVLIRANSNTTLPDIAHKYNCDLDRIIAYNGLENAEDIDDGQYIICPDGFIPLPPKPKPQPTKPATTTTTRQYGVADGDVEVPAGTKGHIFPKGYCTWYVASRMFVPWGGHAKNWLANAKAAGYVTGKEPAPRSIVVTTDNSRYGHVAYVERVENGKILVSEMNFEAFGKVNQRWISIDSRTIRGYIYP